MDQYTINKRKAFNSLLNEEIISTRATPHSSASIAAISKKIDDNIVFLPTEGLKEYGPEGPYAALGIKILEIDKRDPMFTQAILPEGWKITYSDHSMYKNIVDAKDRMRTRFFYKQASYDRCASMWAPERRYTTQLGRYKHDDNFREHFVIDRVLAKWSSDGNVCDEAILHTVKVGCGPDFESRSDAGDRSEKEANEWLDANYPLHKDFMAYWD